MEQNFEPIVDTRAEQLASRAAAAKVVGMNRSRTKERIMSQMITAHFDGKVLVPDDAVELPVGQPLRLHIELTDSSAPRFADLLGLEADLPDAPPNLAGSARSLSFWKR